MSRALRSRSTTGSIRVVCGIPENALPAKYSPMSPGFPLLVVSMEAGTTVSGRSRFVPGTKVTCALANCLRMPSSADTEREGVPL